MQRRGIHSLKKVFETANIKIERVEAGHEHYSKGVYLLQLNTPSNLNAMTEAMGADISNAVDLLQKDNSIRSLVITGSGRAFSAGGDLKFLKDRIKTSPPKNVQDMLRFYSMFLKIRKVPVPTIAAVNGHAVGAGLCFALACDIRLVSTSSKVGLNFSRIGIPPGMAGSHFLPMIAGPQAASKMIFTGDLIDANEAVEYGLALKQIEPSLLVNEAMKMASRISLASPIAVRTAVQSLRRAVDEGLDKALQREADSQAICYSAADLPEGLEAREQKREPKFNDFIN